MSDTNAPGTAAQPPVRPVLPAQLASRDPWIGALIHAGLALAGALVASVVVVASLVIATQLTDVAEVGSMVGSAWWGLVIQMLGAGFLGDLGTTVAVFGATVKVSVFVVPLLVPLGAYLAVRFVAPRLAPAVELALPWRIVVSLAAGFVFAIAVVVLQAIFPVTISAPGIPEVSARAISPVSLLLSFVGVAAMSFAARRIGSRVASHPRAAGLTAAEHLGSVGIVLGAAVFIAAVVQGDDMAGAILVSAPLHLPLVGLAALTVGSFSSLLLAAQGDVPFVGGTDGSLAVAMFSEGIPVWARVLLPVIAVLAIVIAGIRWRVRRGAPASGLSWAALPVAYGLAGLVVMAVGRVSVTGSVVGGADLSSVFGQSEVGVMLAASAGPAAWTFLLFAVIGLAVDVVARFVAPSIARVLPRGMLMALVWLAKPVSASAGDRTPAAPASGDAQPEDPAPVPAAPVDGTSAPVPAPPQTAAAEAAPEAADPFASLLGDDATQEPRPVSHRAKVGWIVAGSSLLVVVLLVVAGAFVRDHLARTQFSATAHVEQYLQHVVQGDAAAALEVWGPNVTTGERVLMTDDIYAAAEQRPTAYEIVDVVESDAQTTVEATLTVDGKAHPVSFVAEPAGTEALIFDAWRITSGPLQNIAVGDVAGTTSVNGVDVDLADVSVGEEAMAAGDVAVLPVLPGTYTFAAPASDGVFTYGDDVTTTVLPGSANPSGEFIGETEPITFEEHWTEDAQQQAIEIVQERVALCMTSDRFQPSDCPNSLGMSEGFMAVTGITRTWEEEPEFTFEEQQEVLFSSGDSGPAVVVSGGELRIDYEERYDDDDDWEAETRTSSSPFGGWSGSVRAPVTVTDSGDVEVDLSAF